MKINLNRPLLDFKGNEAIKVVNGKEVKQYLRDMVSEALYAAGSNPQQGLDMSKKLRAYKMLQQIINNRGVLDIETEDATLLKEICADFFVSGAYGQIYDLIEGGNKECTSQQLTVPLQLRLRKLSGLNTECQPVAPRQSKILLPKSLRMKRLSDSSMHREME